MSLALRAMRIQDVPAVVALERSLFTHPWAERQFMEALEGGYECWVAVIQDAQAQEQLAGYALFSVAGGEADLQDIGVDPGLQRQGVATRLLERGQAGCRERGAEQLFLEVRVSSGAARAFYTSQGFVEVGRRRGYYPADDGREDALLFSKSL